MSNRISDEYSLRHSARSELRRLLESSAPPATPQLREFVLTAVVLVAGLAGVVPAIALGAGAPILAIGLVPLFGVAYAYYIYRTDRIFEGVVSGFFVLAVFSAKVPIYAKPWVDLYVFLVDFVAIALFGILLYHGSPVERMRQFGTAERVAVGGLAMFVLWSFLSALAGNGVSSVVAAVFAVEQLRYLAIFLAAILVAREIGFWCAAYPLVLSIVGNGLFALLEAASGGPINLKYLGTSTGRVVGVLSAGPVDVNTGYYAGGFVGWGREFLAVLLLFLPFLVFWSVYGSRVRAAVSAAGIVAVALLVGIARTDAGWMASLLILAILAAGALAMLVDTSDRRYLRGILASGIGLAASFRLDARKHSDQGGAAAESEFVGTSPLYEFFFDLLARVPLVSASTLGIRFDQYVLAINVALNQPLFGIGGYNFKLMSESYGLFRDFGVHNTYLSHLAATGFPGFVAFMLGILAVLWIVARKALIAEGEARFLWLCVVASLLGFHAYSFWVILYRWQTAMIVFWALSGIAVGARHDLTGQSDAVATDS